MDRKIEGKKNYNVRIVPPFFFLKSSLLCHLGDADLL